MRWRPSILNASSEEFLRHAKLTSGLYAGFHLCFSPLYACFITLDALCSDILFSVCLLGLFLEECRGRFRHCSPSIQGSWYSLMPRSSEFTKNTKALLVGQLLWITAVTLIRASVLFLYNRIFCTKSFRIACYGILSINLAYFTATVLACCLICRPFAFNWDQSIHGSCGDQKSLDLFIGVFNLLMDITTVALPMPVLWGLQMPTGKKIVLSGLFSMGIA